MASRMTICGFCGNKHDDKEKCPCRIEVNKQRNKMKNIKDVETTKFYTGTKWKKFRKSIIKRDGGYCQRCSIKYNMIVKTNLEVHHIKPRSIYDGNNGYPDLRYEPSNCICVCQTCNLQLGRSGVLDFPFTFSDSERSYVL